MSDPATPRRSYDATRRNQQALETRDRVVSAAAQVFIEHGYTGATIPMIASEAGAALRTVYRAAPGKAGLLEAAVLSAVAGGTARADVPVEERPAIRAVMDEPDPRRRLARYAATQPGIWSRVGSLMRVLDAAAESDTSLAAFRDGQDRMRLTGLTALARALAKEGTLRPDLTPERAADVVWTLCSRATYDALVVARGWSHEEYETWLATTLQSTLLDPTQAGQS